MATLKIGFVRKVGYFIYGDDQTRPITKPFDSVNDLITFGKTLAKATFSNLDETINHFLAVEVKKVLSPSESKELAQLRMQEEVTISASNYLDDLRAGINDTSNEDEPLRIIKYKNGIDFD